MHEFSEKTKMRSQEVIEEAKEIKEALLTDNDEAEISPRIYKASSGSNRPSSNTSQDSEGESADDDVLYEDK